MKKLAYTAGLIALAGAAGWLLAADKIDPKLIATGKAAFVDTVKRRSPETPGRLRPPIFPGRTKPSPPPTSRK